MCLNSSTNIPLEAENDIKVYKILGYGYLSPYEKHVFDQVEGLKCITYLYNRGMNKANGPEDIKIAQKRDDEKLSTFYVIGSGFLHAFRNLEDAKNSAKNMSIEAESRYYVYEMVIPKGTSFFESMNGVEICSKSLLFENTTPVFVSKYALQ